MSDSPKILFLDIETSPNIVYMWNMWQEWKSMEMIESEWYILCWCAKYLNKKGVMTSALVDFKDQYKQDPENDKKMLQVLWKLLDEAEVVCGHNIIDFDLKKINSRFMKHGMNPPSPFRVVDTLLSARKHFAFTSNKLGDLGKVLGLGEKLETGGFKLWRGCLKGDKASWKRMVDYCSRDVLLLEAIYNKLLPYIEHHPNMGAFVDNEEPMCPNCASKNLIKRGFAITNAAKYQRIQCSDCGSWSRFKKNLMVKGKVKTTSIRN